LYLYFPSLSFRNTYRTLEPFAERSHVAVGEWEQKFNPKQVYTCKRIAAFFIDETQQQIGTTGMGSSRTYPQSSSESVPLDTAITLFFILVYPLL
jgi:hypothetical protein